MPTNLLTIPQAEQVTQLRRFRIYQLIRQNRFPGVVRFGKQIRIDAQKLEAFIESGGVGLEGQAITPGR